MFHKRQLKLTVLPELEAILHGNKRPSPAELREFREQANRFFRTDDPSMGWVVLSAVAAAEWNVDEAWAVINKSLRAVGNLPQLLANFAVTMENFGLFDEATDFARQAHEAEPLNVEWVRLYTSELFLLGQIEKITEVLQQYLARNSDKRIKEMLEENEVMREGLLEAGVTEQHLQRELRIAQQVLRENKVRSNLLELGPDIDPETGETTVVAVLKFCGSLADEMRLGAALSGHLSDLPEWNPCKLNVDYEHFEIEDVDISA